MSGHPELEYGCRATVTVTLQVQGKGHWGAGATVAEVMQIGGRETVNAIENMIRDSKLNIKLIGTPEVGAVTWENKK